MRHFAWLLALVPLLVGVVSCSHSPEVEEEPPLLLEEPPLLLEEPGEAQVSPDVRGGPVADNSRCHVCHMNYEEEELAVSHARANVGCEECHGDSTPHCSDEDNITAPDIMYPREKINPFCLRCHPGEKLSDLHKFVIAGNAEKRTCADCHGEHRLAYRTRRWNKVTGELIGDDGVRMLGQDPSEQR
jgi:hypothetical protein